jgi:hypothetical protein
MADWSVDELAGQLDRAKPGYGDLYATALHAIGVQSAGVLLRCIPWLHGFAQATMTRLQLLQWNSAVCRGRHWWTLESCMPTRT